MNISDLAAWCRIDFGSPGANPLCWSTDCLYLNGEKLTDLVIPSQIEQINPYAFISCEALKSVTYHNSLKSIGNAAFQKCSGLTELTVPGSVTNIDEYAFPETSISNLKFVYSSAPITIASNALNNPADLTWDRPMESLTLGISNLTTLKIGNSVTEIPANRFKGVSKLTELKLGSGLTAIGDNAFSGCTSLTEVVVPPSVETIGTSAFDGDTKLASIIMGHKVANVGAKAFYDCPATTVSITAQTPPVADNNTFTNYIGKLYVQGQDAADAYYDSDFCWYQFESFVMIEPESLTTDASSITGTAGETFQLTATMYPADVTLPHIFWRSTNPDIATVDQNGLITLHANLSDVMTAAEEGDNETGSCKIFAESLYANGPVAEVTVNTTTTGINEFVDNDYTKGDIDLTAPMQVFNMQGVMVADKIDNLSNGIYIIRQGNKVKKIAVK